MVLQPEFIYAAFVLPALFSLTLIIEGFGKMQRQEPGVIQLATGFIFLVIMVCIFIFFLLQK
jgi:hypothetical protein